MHGCKGAGSRAKGRKITRPTENLCAVHRGCEAGRPAFLMGFKVKSLDAEESCMFPSSTRIQRFRWSVDTAQKLKI